MPVKWTPETDQILLLKILETSDVSPKPTEISEKWPTNLERPTPRAISERIFKIRATAKASGTTGHSSNSATKSNPGTPRKNAANGIAKKTPKKTNVATAKGGKRKRGGRMSDEDGSDDFEANGFKSDKNDSDASEDETPKKKSKANTTAKDKSKERDLVKVKSEEEENGTLPDSSSQDPFTAEDDANEMVNFA